MARRVLPTPPGPVRVSSRQSGERSRSATATLSCSRPIKGVNCFRLACLVKSRPSRSRTELPPFTTTSGLIPTGNSMDASTGVALIEGTSSSKARALLVKISSINCAGLIPSFVSNSCVTPSPSLNTACAIARSSIVVEPDSSAFCSAV